MTDVDRDFALEVWARAGADEPPAELTTNSEKNRWKWAVGGERQGFRVMTRGTSSQHFRDRLLRALPAAAEALNFDIGSEADAEQYVDAITAGAVSSIERWGIETDDLRHRGNGNGHDHSPAEEPEDRYKLLSVREVRELPPVEEQVAGVFVSNSLSCFAGAAGGAKGFLAQHYSMSVAETGHFHGDRKVRKGLVVYVAGEGFAGLAMRFRALCDFHRVTDEQEVPIYVIPAAPQMRNTVDVGKVLRSLESLPCAPSLIIVDTYAATNLGASENDGGDTGLYLGGVDRIRRETGAHVSLIHHTGWNTERERGHTALRAAVDTMVLVTKEDSEVRLSCLKQRDLEPFPDLLFQLRPHGDSAVLTPITEAERCHRPEVLPRLRQKAFDALKTCDEGRGASFTKWFETSGLAKATFNRTKDDLVRWGLIQKQSGKYIPV